MSTNRKYHFVEFHNEDTPSMIVALATGQNPPAGWSSFSCGYDTVEELKAGERIQPKGCSICGQMYGIHYTEDVASVMCAKGICFDCWFWTENIPASTIERSTKRAVIVNGRHYMLDLASPGGKPQGGGPKSFQGFGGAKFVIRWIGAIPGSEVTTYNLWHQGTIPARFRALYPDNAVFV